MCVNLNSILSLRIYIFGGVFKEIKKNYKRTKGSTKQINYLLEIHYVMTKKVSDCCFSIFSYIMARTS